MRPIDADKILETHKFETKLIGKDWTIGDLAAAIECAPILDVVPVAHGRWYDKGSLSCRCSCCGCKSNKEYNYCPYCGAKMDKEK